MKTAVTGWIVMILISVMSILSSGYIVMQMEIMAARNYHSAVIDRIQASNFSPNVIQDVLDDSVTDGYPTTVTDVTLYEDKRDVLVSTEYKIQFPFFGIVETGTIEGYAR